MCVRLYNVCLCALLCTLLRVISDTLTPTKVQRDTRSGNVLEKEDEEEQEKEEKQLENKEKEGKKRAGGEGNKIEIEEMGGSSVVRERG